jgi:MinD-like ATPase involved in chromosome partitioning or flagellar assembly
VTAQRADDGGRVPVLLATSGGPGEAALVAELERPGSGIRVLRRCLDVSDLLGCAATMGGLAALVDARLPRLDRDAVSRLRRAGLVVVVVADAEHRVRASALGADLVVDGREPAELASALRPLVGEPGTPDPGLVGEPPTEHPAPRSGSGGAEPSAVAGPARLIVVWGPTGAPGRSTLALTVADELARRGVRVVLADADTTGPALAQRLALLGDDPALPALVRLAGSGQLTAEAVMDRLVALPGGLRVLTGLARPDRWTDLRQSALTATWQEVVGLADAVVVDVGAGLERDDEVLLDPGLPSRYAATFATLAAADDVVVVGRPDPVGLARLLRGWDQVVDVAPSARHHVVVNRVRRGVTGPAGGDALRRLVRDHCGQPAWLVPDDQRSVDTAELAGTTLAAAAPRSSARRALIELAVHLAPTPRPGPDRVARSGRRRWRATSGTSGRRRLAQAVDGSSSRVA